jgi:hypothetical protein
MKYDDNATDNATDSRMFANQLRKLVMEQRQIAAFVY